MPDGAAGTVWQCVDNSSTAVVYGLGPGGIPTLNLTTTDPGIPQPTRPYHQCLTFQLYVDSNNVTTMRSGQTATFGCVARVPANTTSNIDVVSYNAVPTASSALGRATALGSLAFVVLAAMVGGVMM